MNYKGDKYYIQKVTNGHRDAFSSLVDRYKDNVYSLALRMCNRTEEAEEIAQDSFMKAFRSLNKFKGMSSFPTWLYRITYNTAISSLRTRKNQVLQLEDFPADATDFIQDNHNEQVAEIEYKRTILNFALQKLQPDDRAIISMYYYQELAPEEIVKVLGITKSNLKVRLHRARKKMEKIILKNQTRENMYYEQV